MRQFLKVSQELKKKLWKLWDRFWAWGISPEAKKLLTSFEVQSKKGDKIPANESGCQDPFIFQMMGGNKSVIELRRIVICARWRATKKPTQDTYHFRVKTTRFMMICKSCQKVSCAHLKFITTKNSENGHNSSNCSYCKCIDSNNIRYGYQILNKPCR